MGSLSYTIGNWTIESTETDSISTPKNVPVADLKFSTDYSVKSGGTSTDTKIVNTTSTSLLPCEEIAYGRQDIGNIYDSSRFSVPAAERLTVQQGIRLRIRVDELLNATNSVSGAELKVPLAAWINIDVPKSSVVNAAAMNWILRRVVSACLVTAGVGSTLLLNMARGDLDPTR